MSDRTTKTERVAKKLLNAKGEVISVVYREKEWEEVQPEKDKEGPNAGMYL